MIICQFDQIWCIFFICHEIRSHIQFNCCGVYSPIDWQNVYQHSLMPPSCCQNIHDGRTVCCKEMASQLGCKTALNTFVQSNSMVFHFIYIFTVTSQVFVEQIFVSLCFQYKSFVWIFLQIFGVVFPCIPLITDWWKEEDHEFKFERTTV